MKFSSRFLPVILLAVFNPAFASTETPAPIQRVGNTTLRMPSAPPVYGYAMTNAFGNVSFLDPLAIVSPPGETNRLFVVEQRGRVAVITNLTVPNRTVFLDISSKISGGTPTDERGLLGMAFHPGYATNRTFFLYYSTTAGTAAGFGLHQRLSRFEASETNANAALPGSEVPLLTMYDDAVNHNGGDLHFGPDGLLYVSLGDEGGGNDVFNNSQRIDKDFWSSLLRLDVDIPFRPDSLMPNPHPANTNAAGEIFYRIPADNPFVGATTFLGAPLDPATVRTEMYAVGLRNPWRFSFDTATGMLYCGDVGQEAWEEIDIIARGGNYGWAFREGNVAGPKAAPAGFASLPPVVTYPHGSGNFQGYSVTGGVVYRGNRIPQLIGAYIFADYVTGNVWSMRVDGTNSSDWGRLLVNVSIAGFGVDPSNGDVLAADQGQDTIQRLIPATGGTVQALPPTLADTGAFADLELLTPSPGLVPYDVNVPFWSDHAEKTRWFYVPTNGAIDFQPLSSWTFPTGSVWVKHFELELTNGVAESRRRIETRLLVRASDTSVYGVTYRWDESATNAFLVPDGGLEEEFVIDDGGGLLRTQVWHYPGRSECLQCHSRAGGQVLGCNALQLNRDKDYGSMIANQLSAMSDAGYFRLPLTNLFELRALAPAEDEGISLEQRARSFLAANCAQCHQPGGSGLGIFDARLSASRLASRLLDGPVNDSMGDPNARLIAPGSAEHSMVLTRISRRGPGQMPPLASTIVDDRAISLLSRWITNDLAAEQTFTNWQTQYFGSAALPEASAVADPDADGASNFAEYLTGTNPTNALDSWGLQLERNGDRLGIGYPVLANRRIEIQWSTNLSDPAAWQFLALPENRPVYPATNGYARVLDWLTDGQGRWYRGKVYEP